MRIRYFGHMGERTGYAVAAEHYCNALREHADVVLEEVNINTLESPLLIAVAKEHWLDCTGVDAVIVHTLPGSCAAFKERLTWGGAVVVAYTTWEALTVNRDLAQRVMETFDEVWMPSEASARAWRGAGRSDAAHGINVHVIPHCFPESELVAALPKSSARLRTAFRFLWIGAWTARKNPGGLLRAYCHEFRKDDDVELYLHSRGTPIDLLAAELASTGIVQDDLPRIRFNNEDLVDDQRDSMIGAADCFVSAARGEAWNLPAFEALLHRKHIVTTDSLGSDDFLIDTSAQRVNARAVPAWNTVVRGRRADGSAGAELVGGHGLTARDLWLEPDLVRFGRAMRDVYNAWAFGAAPRIIVHYNLGERYGYAVVAKQILTRLENLCNG